MENLLNEISRKYVQLDHSEIESNNVILKNFLNEFIPAMRAADDLFNQLYSQLYYGGSFYGGLKVTRPNEYDLDLKLKIPKHITSQVRVDLSKPGYVQITFINKYGVHGATNFNKDLESLADHDRYLNTPKVMNWIKGVVQKTLNGYATAKFTNEHLRVKMSESGPAITLALTGGNVNGEIHLDLVPCFVLPDSQWPTTPFRANNVPDKNYFFAVCKPLKEPDTDRYCRLSFQEQEGQLIKGKFFLKPAVKLLKKIRDKYNHPIPSYYIKTVALWMIERKDDTFWKSSLTVVFIEILNEYNQYLKNGTLPYYWNPSNNLLQDVNKATLDNIYNVTRRLLNAIQNNSEIVEQFFSKKTIKICSKL